MTAPASTRLLQFAVALGGLVPVGAGLAGILLGPAMLAGIADGGELDSHLRYLSGLLLGIGLAFWAMIPRIRLHGPAFRLLTGIVIVGGLGRLYGMLAAGLPPMSMRLALVMELVVTPALCLWQWRLTRS